MAVAVASSLLLGLTSIAIDAVFGANSFTSSTGFAQALAKGRDQILRKRLRGTAKKADDHCSRGLRLGGDRREEKCAGTCDERASIHVNHAFGLPNVRGDRPRRAYGSQRSART